jgi:hypothetical protein
MEIMLQTVEALRERRVRDEDLKQRQYVNQRMLIDDARRLVDKKSEQLKSIAEIAALIGGFAMVVLVETFIDQEVHNQILLFFFGTFTALVVCLMFLCLIISTLMLVTVLNFNTAQSVIDNTLPFEVFWRTRCESDFQFSFQCFKLAIPCFIVSLCCLGWIKFNDSMPSAISISTIGAVVLVLWLFKALPKWGSGAGEGIGADLYDNAANVNATRRNQQQQQQQQQPPLSPDSYIESAPLTPMGPQEGKFERGMSAAQEELQGMN